jgi:hypothetical protein
VLLALLASAAVAQTPLRPYPDPGHRWLGVYAGGPEQTFDYFLRKLSLEETFPDKAAWWQGWKQAHRTLPPGHRHDVFIVYCGEKQGDLADARRRIDAWLKPEPGIDTFPELIPAICLGEENLGAHNALLEGLARHIRETYGIPVLQWYSDPLPPSPALTADGWIWDSYGWDSVRFRKHLMKFAVLRKPALCVPWAADPHWPQWTQYPTAAALIDREWRQFDICREFNIGCAVFAVAGPHGSVNTWAGSTAPELVTLRNALRTQRAAMHAVRPGELPLASAGFSARDLSPQVGGDPEAASEYLEAFDGFDWLHAADVRGFLDLRLTSQPATPGFLELLPRQAGPARAELIYRFESWFPIASVEVELRGEVTGPTARNTFSLAAEETDGEWPHGPVQSQTTGLQSLRLQDEAVVRGRRVCFVRVLMENPRSEPGTVSNRLDQLRVRVIHQPPPPGAAATLQPDDNDVLGYRDDFRTNRWRHLGTLTTDHPTHGGWRDGGFWVGLKGGTATSTHLVQRFTAPRALQVLRVEADCYADAPNLGGSVRVAVAPRGAEPRWSVTSPPRQDGWLNLEIPPAELGGLAEFDLHIWLHSGSGVEQGPKACATLRAVRLTAK